MVKKLLKHEFAYYLRTVGLTLPAILVLGIVVRLFRAFHQEGNYITGTALFFSVAMLIIGCVGVMLFITVVSIVRFYRNLFSLEGYLTFTLPVNNHQHILVKLFVSMVFQVAGFVAMILAVLIAVSGKGFVDACTTAFRFVFENIENIPVFHILCYIFYIILLSLISMASSNLLYYGCIAIGQLAKKNRILMAILAYFVHYVIMQMLSTLGTILSITLAAFDLPEFFLKFLARNPYLVVHLFFLVAIAISLAFTAVYYRVTHYIMTKKLNLE